MMKDLISASGLFLFFLITMTLSPLVRLANVLGPHIARRRRNGRRLQQIGFWQQRTTQLVAGPTFNEAAEPQTAARPPPHIQLLALVRVASRANLKRQWQIKRRCAHVSGCFFLFVGIRVLDQGASETPETAMAQLFAVITNSAKTLG